MIVTILGVILGVTLKLLMKAAVMPVFGAQPINQAYHFLAGNRTLLPAAAFSMLLVAFSEETVFRSFLFERLRKAFGDGVATRVAVVLGTSAAFAAAHLPDQGVAGAQQAFIVGATLGTIFVVTRQIWLPIIAHAAFNLTALALIYYEIEADVAQFMWQ